jgi:predicted AlkP superfamily phosphohydrolase/phosphomutase
MRVASDDTPYLRRMRPDRHARATRPPVAGDAPGIEFYTTRPRTVAALVAALVSGVPSAAEAYIGPGAGFALLTSFLVFFTTMVVAAATVVAWPVRVVWLALFGTRIPPARIGRLVIVGLDGQDPNLTDRFMGEGLLPNLRRLSETGCYRRLRTTFPAVSPVAWSSFSTGTGPGRHNIFDFLDRDRRTYLPRLSSARVGAVERFLSLGRYRIPLQRPELRLLRRSKPFWTILGEHRVWSTILRVPVTFPPDRFYGAELGAMGIPDLLGTQGTFLLYTTRPPEGRFKEGGLRVPVTVENDRIETTVQGPGNLLRAGSPPLEIPLRIRIDRARDVAHAQFDQVGVDLTPGRLSDWVTLAFRPAPGLAVTGLVRLLVLEMEAHFSLYVSPISIDPERPAMPVSHPSFYATYLAKRIGTFSTLGLAEDTWALNERVIDEGIFLQQAYDIDRERQAMLFAALDRLRRGVLVCVFDAPDRIQHMFWRYLEAGHPARAPGDDRHRDAIRDIYVHTDTLVGRVLDRLGRDDVLMVISDHGFSSFRRGVNLNAWLRQAGYLVLKEGADGTAEWLRDVDWSRTRAYALGLTGMFLNLQGRERHGIVTPGPEAAALKAEIAARLGGFRDEEAGTVAINEAFDTSRLYAGPYLENAPDLLIAYNAGYRTSWEGASGVVAGAVLEDNVKPWSGDHCIDPRLVPGVFFCNRVVHADDPALVDIAPTALRLFGIEPPAYMDGRPLEGIA